MNVSAGDEGGVQLDSGGARVSVARGIYHFGTPSPLRSSFPFHPLSSLPLDIAALEVGLLNLARGFGGALITRLSVVTISRPPLSVLYPNYKSLFSLQHHTSGVSFLNHSMSLILDSLHLPLTFLINTTKLLFFTQN